MVFSVYRMVVIDNNLHDRCYCCCLCRCSHCCWLSQPGRDWIVQSWRFLFPLPSCYLYSRHRLEMLSIVQPPRLLLEPQQRIVVSLPGRIDAMQRALSCFKKPHCIAKQHTPDDRQERNRTAINLKQQRKKYVEIRFLGAASLQCIKPGGVYN